MKEDVFNVGDRVKPVRDMKFDDGTLHLQNKVYEVTPINRWYFNLNCKDYYKIS